MGGTTSKFSDATNASTVHLWLFDLDATQRLYKGFSAHWLSDKERARMTQFTQDIERLRYCRMRVLIRMVLAEMLGTSAKHVTISYEPKGRPCIEGRPNLSISYSHCRNLGVLAFSQIGDIGIDLEWADPRRLNLVNLVLSEGEKDVLENATLANRLDIFMRFWTRKEAYFKAIGTGLIYPITDVDTSNWQPHLTQYWDLDGPRGFFGALYVSNANHQPQIKVHSSELVVYGPASI
ncbi:4'-phosphopantetheinyl transferase family protein [Shimia isoporae]|uniref:4'-phosphopantetheinyl transferase family protein n=1 Tax=Shimia isoporae TaxID=647720 RepID=UPI0010536539|nr:4'-phosphopantetheinyl transferase superfamily protein [Shimia isoporae]